MSDSPSAIEQERVEQRPDGLVRITRKNLQGAAAGSVAVYDRQ